MKPHSAFELELAVASADLVTEEEIVVEIASRIRRRGDHQRVAGELGISQPGLSNILTGGRAIGAAVAERLGYRKVIRYERVS